MESITWEILTEGKFLIKLERRDASCTRAYLIREKGYEDWQMGVLSRMGNWGVLKLACVVAKKR